MKTHVLTTGLALTLLLPLLGCSEPGQAGAGAPTQADRDAGEQTSSLVAAQIHKGIAKARQELLTEDIDINHVGRHEHGEHEDGDSRPKAVITPRGELVIAGKPVPATPTQHGLLLDYRQQIIGVAQAGMEIGEHGANLGTQAAKEAIWGALTGKSDKEIEDRIKPQTEQIKAAAAKICLRLPDMLASQQKLAAAMPEFRPYATMTQNDIDDCGKDIDN